MAHIYLVSDTRERYVHGLIESLFDQAGAGHVVYQINTGDYLICRRLAGGQPEILACIERKTLKDFAASFKDGRYLNRNKMMDLRDKTGCQLYFFVEGAAFPKPTWKVSRIPYGSILSAMTNMMVRDGIHVVQTENEMGTAQRLLDFVRAFEKADVPYRYPVGGGSESASESASGTASEINTTGVPDLVMGTIEKDDEILATEMWGKLTGISLPTAQLIAKTFSVSDIVGGRVSDAELDALRTAGGRQLVKKGRDSLRSLRRGSQKDEVKILSGIPGISPAMATQILTTGGANSGALSLSALLALGERGVAGVSIRQKGRTVRLGDARAERICRLLTYVNVNVNGIAGDNGSVTTAGDDNVSDSNIFGDDGNDNNATYEIPAGDMLGDDDLDALLL